MHHRTKKIFLMTCLALVQFCALICFPIPVRAQTVYKNGVAYITNTVPLNRDNATTQTDLSTDNTRFINNLGVNVSDLYARNINYQNREFGFNDSLSNMNLTTIATRSGYYHGAFPDYTTAFGYGWQNLSLVPEIMDITDRIQAVGKKSANLTTVQAVALNLQNTTDNVNMDQFMVGVVNGSIVSSANPVELVLGGGPGKINSIYFHAILNFTGDTDWVIDFTCNRFGITVIIAEYFAYFTTQTYISVENATHYGYPVYISANADKTAYSVFIDMVANRWRYTYHSLAFIEFANPGATAYNSMGIEGFDSRLLGYIVNNTLYPDYTFYPDRFDQVYQLFYEPYQNFESTILSYDHVADPDYISMSYEFIGNRWISGENGEVFFPTDDISHFLTDYSNVKRHILLSGNLLYLAGAEKVEYKATYTFLDNTLPTDWTYDSSPYQVYEDIVGHFHVVGIESGTNAVANFSISQSLTSWSFETYFWATNGESINFTLQNGNATSNLTVSINDGGFTLNYNDTVLHTDATDFCDELWHRLVVTADAFALFTATIDFSTALSGTIADFSPSEFSTVAILFSGPLVFVDALGVAEDRGYTADLNLEFYDRTVYTTSFLNTIFDKRTSGIVFTWTSNHNRYNLTATYFNFNVTFQIYITYVKLWINETCIYTGGPPSTLWYNSYLKRPVNYELWVYPWFDGSDYYIGIDYSADNNRTVIFCDSFDPLNVNLSESVQTWFYMYDADIATVIVFTSTIKSLLKLSTSTTRYLTFSNRHYLTRKMIEYRFTDNFAFGKDDMRIFINDGVFTKEVTDAISIIPTNLTASQQIIQTNTTQYNNAECLTEIALFNKTVQLYSENGYNVTETVNDTTLFDIPVTGRPIPLNAQVTGRPIPLNAQWYRSVGNSLSTIAHIVQQSASNPVGIITAIVAAINNQNYRQPDPVAPAPPTTDSKYHLPIEHGSVNVPRLILDTDIGLNIRKKKSETPPTQDEICDSLRDMIAKLTLEFFGAMLGKKMWEILQLNKAYEACNMISDAWDYFGGITPTTVANVKLTVTVTVTGIFSFTETGEPDSWISFVVDYLIPFILPIALGYLGKRMSPKLVPFGVVIGFIVDGVAGLLPWNYIIVFSILGGVGCYFAVTKPHLNALSPEPDQVVGD